MKLPKMSKAELAVFAACYAIERHKWTSVDNGAADQALDTALWDVQCFKQAVRERKEDK